MTFSRRFTKAIASASLLAASSTCPEEDCPPQPRVEQNDSADEWQSAAFVLGSSNIKLTLMNLTGKVQQLMHGDLDIGPY